MICYRRPKDLKDHLVRAKLCKTEVVVAGMFKCGGKRCCKVCDSIVVGNTFRSSVCGRTFCINHHFNCDSLAVAYLITSKKCEKQYVDCIVTPFRKKFNSHKSSLNRYGKGTRKFVVNIYTHISMQRGIRALKIFWCRLLT